MMNDAVPLMQREDSPLLSSEKSDDAYDTKMVKTTMKESGLSTIEVWNLTFSLLAWALTVSNLVLVVGSSAVVALAVGSDEGATSVPLGAFFLGCSAVSLTMTSWLFASVGRRRGLAVGLLWGFGGTVGGLLAVYFQSFALLVLASFFFGMATGIGFFWRFLVVELVPAHWAARAVTLVVSGGCLAAFAGPESAQAAAGWFHSTTATRTTMAPHNDDSNHDRYAFLGTFLMTGLFNAVNGLCTVLVQFPPTAAAATTRRRFWQEWDFLLPVVISGLAWAIMAVPMSVVRVAMHQVGFRDRQSLTTIEWHFVGMYAPGFVAGSLIQRYGPAWVCALGGLGLGLAIGVMVLAMTGSTHHDDDDDAFNNNNCEALLWTAGLFLVGVGWNLGFTGATVWTASAAPVVQAANDSLMFAFAGGWIVSASYIFRHGGWLLVQEVLLGLLGLYLAVVALGLWGRQRRCRVDAGTDDDC